MRRVLIALGVVALLLPINANASVWTDTALFQASGTNNVGPLSFTSLVDESDAGRMFTNTADWSLNTRIRTVGATLIASAKSQGAIVGGITTLDQQREFVAIFGIDGTVSNILGPGAVEGLFTKGRLQVAEIPIGSFAPDNVLTWGFNGTIAGEYELKGQEPILPGSLFVPWAEPITRLASEVNVSGANSAIGADTQGLFLFKEDPEHPLLDSDSGLNGFLAVLYGIPDDWFNECLIVDTDHELVFLDETILGAPEEVVLNNIGNWAFNTNFANFDGVLNTFDDFGVEFTYTGMIPTGVTDTDGTGIDFVVNWGGDAIPGLQPIPEPASVAIWGLMFALGLVWGFRKRR